MEPLNIAHYQQQLQEKLHKSKELLYDYIQDVTTPVFRSKWAYFRQRVEFGIWHIENQCRYNMVDPLTKQPIFIDSFPIASIAINECMTQLLHFINHIDQLRQKLFLVRFLSNKAGELVITLVYHRPLDQIWLNYARELKQNLSTGKTVHILGRSRKQKIVIDQDYLVECFSLGHYSIQYKQIEGNFTQTNAVINQSLLAWAYEMSNPADKPRHEHDLLELYCGNGNFTFPLSYNYRKVLATEQNKQSIKALEWGITCNQLDNISYARMSAAEMGQALAKEREFRRLQQIGLDDYHFGTLLVNPPRAGLDNETINIAKQFPHVIYISCNPHTLAGNLQQLHKSFKVTHCAFFDQFPYSEHIEVGVVLRKRKRRES